MEKQLLHSCGCIWRVLFYIGKIVGVDEEDLGTERNKDRWENNSQRAEMKQNWQINLSNEMLHKVTGKLKKHKLKKHK